MSVPSKVSATAAEIASLTGGTVIGDATVEVSAIKPLESAGPGDLTFYHPKTKKAAGAKLQQAITTKASAILVSEAFPNLNVTQILVKHPYVAATQLAAKFHPAPRPALGVHPSAVVDPSATLGDGVSIGAYAVIGANVQVGRGTIIHPHAVIYSGAIIGDECVIHAGAVIREFTVLGADCLIQPGVVLGGDGFGYIPEGKKGHRRIPHVGVTVLEDSVDVGANSTVDRATFGETRVKKGTKIDNLVMIGHNCVVGERCFLCAMVGLSGSTTVGDDAIFAGQAATADHVTIGNNVRVAARGGVTSDVPDNVDIAGFPQQDASTWRKEIILLRRLPDILKQLKPLLQNQEPGQDL